MKESSIKIGLKVFFLARFKHAPEGTPKTPYYGTVQSLPKNGYVNLREDCDNSLWTVSTKVLRTYKLKYTVFNYTDNIPASREGFRTMKEVRTFIKEFKERFKQQGYYRDNKWNKVPIEMIDLEIIPIDFNPFKK